jgi:hypothetical protein
VDQCPGQMPPWQRPSQTCRWDPVMTSALKNSQIDHGFDDSTQIWTPGYAHSKQKIKANLLVVSPLLNGRRRHAGDMDERRRTMTQVASSVHDARGRYEESQRTNSSPRSSCSGRSRGVGSGTSGRWTVEFPDELRRKGTAYSQ